MILLDGNQEAASTPEQGTPSAGGTKAEGPPSSQKSTTRRSLAAAMTGVANLWLQSKTAHQTQQLKDRPSRVHAFSNKAAQFHAEDLFDLETCALELSELVKGLTPYLTSNVVLTPPDIGTSSEVNASGETRPPTVGDILSPLLSKIGGLHCLVDNCVHLQQSAGVSKVGYNAFYAHKHSHPNDLKHYGYSRASDEFLA